MHKSAVTGRFQSGAESPQLGRIRREMMRWRCLVYLDCARPEELTEIALLALIQAIYPDASDLELRRELDYLKMRNLLTITERACWFLRLTYQGVDVVEYTTSCPDGIGRPLRPEAS